MFGVPSGNDGLLIAGKDRIDLTVLGETSAVQLGEHEISVLRHFEAPTITRDEQKRLDSTLVILEQFLRQTDGTRLVVSDRTISQFNLHEVFLGDDEARLSLG